MGKLTRMRTFCRAAETLNFSRAAELLGISPAMVSKQVSALENELGVRLFQRSTRRIRLTEEGLRYHRRCRTLLNELEAMEAGIRAGSDTLEGPLRLALPTDLGIGWSATLVSAFLARHPGVHIGSFYHDDWMDLVENGFDLAIRLGNRLPDSSLIARRVGQMRMVLCASPAYLERQPPIRHPRDLPRHNCLCRHDDRSGWRLVGPAGEERILPDGNLHSNDGQALLVAARRGLGVALLPRPLAQAALAAGELRQILPAYRSPEIGIHAVYPHQAFLPPRVRHFIDFLQQALTRDDAERAREAVNWH